MDPKFYEPVNCARCAREYREIDNLGRFQCAMHPAEYNFGNCSLPISKRIYSRYHWLCCGRSQDTEDPHYEGMRPIGCRPSDHMMFVGRYSLTEPEDEEAPFFPLLEAVPLDVLEFAKHKPKQASIVCTIRSGEDQAKTYSYTDWDGSVFTFVPAAVPRFAELNAAEEEERVANDYEEESEGASFAAYAVIARAAPSLNKDKVVDPRDMRRCGATVQ